MIQIKPSLILLNIELMFSYPLYNSTCFIKYACPYIGIKEKEGKREEETGADLSSSDPLKLFENIYNIFKNANNS